MTFDLRDQRPRRAFLWVALVVALLAAVRAALQLAAGDLAILCLHGVDDPNPAYAPWSLTRERFEAVLARVRASGRQVVGPEALERLGDGTSGVLLTFDDSRRSDLTVVKPALAARGWSALFFVPPEGPPRKLLSEELRELAAAGHVLGSHSQTHSRFQRGEGESQEAFRERLREEAIASRRSLELILHGEKPVELFAYPRGEAPPEAVEAVEAAGYRWAFTTEYDHAAPGVDRLRVPRFMLFAETPLEDVEEFLRQPTASQRSQLATAVAVALLSLLGLAWIGPVGSRETSGREQGSSQEAPPLAP